MAIVSGASNYAFIDQKLGTTGGPNKIPPLGATLWKPGTVYGANVTVQNGGFTFNTTAGGTSAAAVAVGPTPNGLTDNTVTWTLGAAIGGPYAIDSVQTQELGYQAIVKDFGPNAFGTGFAQYVAFGGTTVPGDVVVIDQYNQSCARCGQAGAKGYAGVSLGSGAAGKFGWVLIAGVHDYINALSGTSAVKVTVYASTTAGQLYSTASAGNGVAGLVLQVTADTQNRAQGAMSWPTLMGNP